MATFSLLIFFALLGILTAADARAIGEYRHSISAARSI